MTKKPRQNYMCNSCNKSFKTNSILKQHIESVHEGKIFKCSICLSNFTQKVNLKKHIESVHEEKTFKCEIDLSFKFEEQ